MSDVQKDFTPSFLFVLVKSDTGLSLCTCFFSRLHFIVDILAHTWIFSFFKTGGKWSEAVVIATRPLARNLIHSEVDHDQDCLGWTLPHFQIEITIKMYLVWLLFFLFLLYRLTLPGQSSYNMNLFFNTLSKNTNGTREKWYVTMASWWDLFISILKCIINSFPCRRFFNALNNQSFNQ